KSAHCSAASRQSKCTAKASRGGSVTRGTIPGHLRAGTARGRRYHPRPMTVRPGSDELPLRVCVIGSGPSAFYAAEALIKADGLRVQIDMFDRLPTPFGLVRGGVAPDHQNIKTVVKVYQKVAEHPAFRFFGNVKIGRDLQIADLERCYHAVIWAI